ncbi:hypothetical protein CVT26_012755 [Gymnopilus dilepis]|uniref:Class II aldolase/adducin N-terminal domain-containing protein n=1 Tax=Gymnopilus dilepis TaxID=231916 RepID=A0A409X5C3_9AGAR|nr:hypothetical protein CVT26_012755 [Gymnopilus dilepis]
MVSSSIEFGSVANTITDSITFIAGHGMAVRGSSIRDAVFRSFYTKQSATVQLQGVLLGGLAPGGKQPAGLTVREAMDAAVTNEGESLLDRAWNLWVAQVGTEAGGLYVNDLAPGR